MKTKSTVCVIACPTDTPTKRRLVVHNLHYLTTIAHKFIFVDSEECRPLKLEEHVRNAFPSLDASFLSVPNDSVLRCALKIINYLKNNQEEYYVYGRVVVMTNDSYNPCKDSMKTKSTICIIVCHTDTLTKRRVILHNLQYLTSIAHKFVFVDSEECLPLKLEEHVRNAFPSLDASFLSVPNDSVFLCALKIINYLENNREEYSVYDRIVLTNDSFIICNSLDKFGLLKEDDNYDMVGILASNEIRYHYPDFLRAYKTSEISKLVEYFRKNQERMKTTQDLIEIFEIDSTQLFPKRKAVYEAEPGYMKNIHFDVEKLDEYIIQKDYPIVKLRYLCVVSMCTMYENTQALPIDLDMNQYRKMYPFLTNMSDSEISHYYIKHGMKEGVRYRKGQTLPYTSIQQRLEELRLTHLQPLFE
jgi:hypothetical protein